jgi:Na+/melibiose symporter-like transporter
VITALAAPESTDPGSGRHVDLPGLAALSVGLTAVVLALVQARVWSGAAVVALAVLGLAALAAFWVVEHRSAEPIVDFDLFRNGPYFGASAAAFALVGAYWSVMFFQSQYLQDVRGHSAVLSGLMILPITVPMIFISPRSGSLIARFGARRLMTAGMAFAVAGLIVLTQVGAGSPYGLVLAGYLPFGVAIGLVYAPMSTAAMAAMPPEKVGIASGVLAMDRVMAGTVALAATGALSHALLEGGDSFSEAIAGSAWILVGLCAVGTGLTWAFVRGAEPTPPDHHRHHRFHL